MKDQSLENNIVTLHGRGWSIRRLSKEFAVGRTRVRRLLSEHRESRSQDSTEPAKPQTRESKIDAYKALIHELVEAYKDPPATGQRIYEMIKEKGYDGGVSILREYLIKIRTRGIKEVIRCVETEAGQRAAHDWSEYAIEFTCNGSKEKIILFSYILCYCRRQYIEIVKEKTQPTLLQCLINAFIYFEGVPREVKSDNQKACVDRWELGHPVFNKHFLSFATHYCFRPLTIHPGKPTENLKIERPFYYLETNFLNTRSFADKEDLKGQLMDWLKEKNDKRIHRTTNRRPLDMYAEELPYLQRLPCAHYDTSVIAYRVVNGESCIQLEGYYYYVPSRWLFESCPVRITTDRVIIYSPECTEIANHPLAEKNQAGRYVGLPAKCHRNNELPVKEIIERLKVYGKDMERLTEEVKKHKSNYAHHLQGLLQLKINYHADDILIAVRRALQYRIYDIRAIENFLSLHAVTKHAIKILPQKNNPHEENPEQ